MEIETSMYSLNILNWTSPNAEPYILLLYVDAQRNNTRSGTDD